MSDDTKNTKQSEGDTRVESRKLAQPDVRLTSPPIPEQAEAEATARTPEPTATSGCQASVTAKTDFAWNVHRYINDYIRFADTKAGVILTYCSALIGALYASGLHHRFNTAALALGKPGAWLALLAFALLFLGAFFAVLVVRPKLWNKQVPGLIFWESILGHHSPEALWREFSARSETELEEHLIHHQFMLSRICSAKYRIMTVAIWLSGIGAVIAAGLLIVGQP